MKKEIYAISLLLSFLVVFGHMMVPHHHHESFIIEASSNLNQQEAHSHPHNGNHHHSHDDEKEKQTTDHSEHSFPQHFHFSATDDFDLVRVNHTGRINYLTDIQSSIDAELLSKRVFNPLNISSKTFSYFFVKSQTAPGANGLRGPPSIA